MNVKLWVTLIWYRIIPLEDHRENSEEGFFYFAKVRGLEL